MMTDFTRPGDPFLEPLAKALTAYPKRLVFTEGEDDRIIQVAGQLAEEAVVLPILLGDGGEIEARAEKLGVDLGFVRVLNPSESPDRIRFAEYFERSERIRGNRITGARDLMSRPHYFGAMMVQYGQADGMISGNQTNPAAVHRAMFRMLKPLPPVSRSFSMVVLTDRRECPAPHFGPNGFLLMADCHMLTSPTVEETAMVAVESGRLASEYLGRPAEVALLSHSNFGSENSGSAQRMAAATNRAWQLAKERNLELQIRGEIQADVALNPDAADAKGQGEQFRAADVLVFPNTDSGHIAYKLLVHVGGFPAYGQLVVGFAGPVAQVPRNAPAEQIFGTALMVGAEAIKYHTLYPRGLY